MGSFYDKMKPPNVSDRRLRHLQYILLSAYVITMLFEVAWTYFSIIKYKDDISTYDTDEIWKREFYKATRNFFIFTEILNFLVLCIGCVAVIKNHRILLIIFIVMFLMEWGFELIGIYASMDFKIFIYKIVCQAFKPILLLSSMLYCWVMKEPSQ